MAFPTNPVSPTEILSNLPAKFDEARSSGQLFFFPSEAKDVYAGAHRFNLRCCPALQDKARAKAEALEAVKRSENGSPDPKRQKRDEDAEEHSKQNKEEPFKPPYVPELFVGALEGLEGERGMSVLLNKYSLLPEHFLLCPTVHEPQALPPTPAQLALAHNILLASARHPTRPRRLIAFYNGGPGAGASQAWRHLQFVEVPGGRAPIEEWVQGMSFDRPDRAVIHPTLPHLHIVHPLPSHAAMTWPPTSDSSSELIDALAPAVMRLLDIAFDANRRANIGSGGGWNLIMTLDHLHLIPRTAPSFQLPEPHQPLELNSLGYAGMMLVRSGEEEQTLLEAVGDGGLMKVLETCGLPRTWGEQALEAEAKQQGMGELA